MKTVEVRDAISIERSVGEVFEAITDARKLERWWPKVALSVPEAGGVLVFEWFNGSKIETRYETVVENEEVSFQFGSEFVRIDIVPIDSKVKVNVVHSKISVEESIDGAVHIAQTWRFLLINLKSYLEYSIDFRASI